MIKKEKDALLDKKMKTTKAIIGWIQLILLTVMLIGCPILGIWYDCILAFKIAGTCFIFFIALWLITALLKAVFRRAIEEKYPSEPQEHKKSNFQKRLEEMAKKQQNGSK